MRVYSSLFALTQPVSSCAFVPSRLASCLAQLASACTASFEPAASTSGRSFLSSHTTKLSKHSPPESDASRGSTGPASASDSGRSSSEERIENAMGRNWRMVEVSDLKTITKEHGRTQDDERARLIARSVQNRWPPLTVSTKGQADAELTQLMGNHRCMVLLVGYRQSAEDYIPSWSQAIEEHCHDVSGLQVVRLNLIDVKLLSYWPFRGMIVNQSQPATTTGTLPVQTAYHFVDDAALFDDLGLRNRLTAYVLLLDDQGYVRWRASGEIMKGEGESLRAAIDSVLKSARR